MILAIDTSQMTYSLASDNGHFSTWSDIQITLYDQLQSINTEDINTILINIGPGRFSGLRSGIAFAQGLARAKSIDIYTMNHFELIAHKKNITTGTIALDARKGEAYLQHIKQHKTQGDILLIKQEQVPQDSYGNLPNIKQCTIDARDLLTYYTNHNIQPTAISDISPIYIRASV